MGIDKEEIGSILVRAPGWIGDSIISMPVVKTLRENFPKAYLCISVKDRVRELWKGFSYADEVVSDKEQHIGAKRKYDLGIIFPHSFSAAYKMFRAGARYRAGYSTELRGLLITHRTPKSGKFRSKHLMEEYFDILRHLGLKILSKELFFEIPPGAKSKIEALIRKKNANDGRPLIGICPGASYGKAKAWPAGRFAEVVNYCAGKYSARAAVFAGKGEMETSKMILQGLKKHDILSTGGNMSIKESAALINKCDLLISNDTGPMHLAAALKVPVVGIFGSTNPIWTGPLGGSSKVLYKKIPCSPCFKRVCPKETNRYECLLKITVQSVIKEIEKLKVL